MAPDDTDSNEDSTSPSSGTNDESKSEGSLYPRRNAVRTERQKMKRLSACSSIQDKMAPGDTYTTEESTSPSSDTNDESTSEGSSFQRRKGLRRERQKKKRLSARSSIQSMAPDDTDTDDESQARRKWRKRKDRSVDEGSDCGDFGLEMTVSRRRVASESDQSDIERSNLSSGEASMSSNKCSQSEGPNEGKSESDINSDSSSMVTSIDEDSVGHVDDVEDNSLKPVCAGSGVTRGTFEALLLALSKKHKFSKSAKQDLLKLMHTVVSEPNLPSSNYAFEKDLFHEIGIQYQKFQLCPVSMCFGKGSLCNR